MKVNLFLTFLFASLANSFTAQTIDNTFGINGTLNLNIGSFYGPTALNDGKTLLAGVYDSGTDYISFLTKANVDGSADTSFGVNGRFEMNMFSGTDYYEEFGNARILPDGKILLLYYYGFDNGVDAEINATKLIRLNPNGTVDPTFNSPIFAGDNDYFYGAEVLPNGKILCISANSIKRFLPDGALDTSYANSGVRNLVFEPYEFFVDTAGVYLYDYLGKKVVKLVNEESPTATFYENGETLDDVKLHNGYLYITSFNNTTNKTKITKLDGNLSTVNTFGVNGVYLEPVENTYYYIAGIQENGSVLVYGNTFSPNNELMKRINPNGVQDLTFGNSGVFTFPSPPDYYGSWFYHPFLKKLYLSQENYTDGNNAIVTRFNLPAEILAVKSATSYTKISVLENPVKEVLKLSSSLKSASIYNVLGSKTPISFASSEVSVSKLSPGVYFISGIDENGKSVNLKFIKE